MNQNTSIVQDTYITFFSQVLFARRLSRECGGKVKFGASCWSGCTELLAGGKTDDIIYNMAQFCKSRAADVILDQLKEPGK